MSKIIRETMATLGQLPRWMQDAIWEGDLDVLQERAPCVCCCSEHTFDHCPARAWEGCRGQGSMTQADVEAWAAHYGMTLSQFYG